MLREQERSLRPARIRAQIIAIGVRDSVRAADADLVAVLDELRRLFERHDLLAQAAVALDGLAAQFQIGVGQRRFLFVVNASPAG